MSGAHIFNIARGRQVNPKVGDVQALATFFHVPVGYLVDDGGDYRRLEAELDLLGTFKRGGVKEISIEGDPDSPLPLPVVRREVVREIDKLALFGDARARAIVDGLAALRDEQRRAVEEIIADPAVIESLAEPAARSVAARLGTLTSSQLDSLGALLATAGAVDALATPGVPEIAVAVAALPPVSRQAVATLVDQLNQPRDV